MKRIILLGAIIICSLQFSYCRVDSVYSGYPNISYDSLQVEKMKLEILELKNNETHSNLKWLLSIFGGITGVITILWTIYHGIKNYRNQIKQQQDKTISDLLVMINDDNPNKRAGAAKGLSKYSNLATNEIISSIAIEKEEFVREIIEETLLTLTKENFKKVITANQEMLRKKVVLLGELSVTKIPLDKVEAALKLTQEYRIQLLKNYRYLYDHGKIIAMNKKIEAITAIPNEYIVRIQRILFSIESTGKIISKLLKKNNINGSLCNIDISYTELYKLNLIEQIFDNVYATNTICRHIIFNKSTLVDSNFNSADMFDSNFENSEIKRCDFSNAILRQSNWCNIKIENSTFTDKAILSESNFERLEIINTNFSRAIFKNFHAHNGKFLNTKFHSAELQHSSFQGSIFENCEFFGATIIEGNFKDCRFVNSKFNGADLRGTNFENAYLKSVDFSGANLKNTNKINWTTIDCLFDKAKDLSNKNET